MADRRADDDPVSPTDTDGRTEDSGDGPPGAVDSGAVEDRPASGDGPEDRRASDDGSGGDGSGDLLGRLYYRATTTETWRLIVAVTALALVIRLVGLGTRPMHYDEGRVAYWMLHSVESGSFAYRHGIHGPFLQHTNRWLFPLVGASDFTARLPVALAGGLLPLGALAFRNHLEKAETVALALFLAFNSVLVYYSRFMRSDVLLAAFMFGAFACLVGLYDTRDARYLYGVAVLAALGFATKENAIVYVLTWVGAAALLADQALYRPRRYRSGLAVAFDRLGDPRAVARRLLPYAWHVVGALVVFLLVLVFMYADRGAGMAGIRRPPVPPGEGAVGFWEALANPAGFPGYAYDTLASATGEALEWGGRTSAGDSENFLDTYVSNLGADLETLGWNAPILVVFGVVGFVWERYARPTGRNLVMFAGYCGFVSLLGYPLADDIGSAHWLNVHVLVPLAIPAAVGAARFYRWGRNASLDRDTVGTAAATFILILASVQVAAANAGDVYADSTSRENKIAQYAQPQTDTRAVFDAVNAVSDGGNDTEVVIYTGANYSGSRPIVGGPDEDLHPFILRPECQKSDWYNSLPLPWYLTKAGTEVDCETDPEALATLAGEAPLVITRTPDESVPTAALGDAYVARTFDMYQWDHQFTVYLREDRVAEVPGWRNAGTPPPS
jgi:uncharacterized protein (TIGR03663 family)